MNGKGHNVLMCPCKDCSKRRQVWALKRAETRRNRNHQNAPKYEPPANVERRTSSNARDDVITRAPRLPKRTDLKKWPVGF